MVRLQDNALNTVRRGFVRSGFLSVLVLSLTALIGVFGTSWLSKPTQDAYSRGEILSLQAMRAQKVSQLVSMMTTPEKMRDLFELRNALSIELRAFEQGHQDLIRGNPALGFGPPTNEEQILLMMDPQNGLDRIVYDMIRLTEASFLDSAGRAERKTVERLIYLIHDELNPIMSELLRLQGIEARGRVRTLLTGQTIVGAGFVILGLILWLTVHNSHSRDVISAIDPTPDKRTKRLLRTLDPSTYLPNSTLLDDRLKEEHSALKISGGVATLMQIRFTNLAALAPDGDAELVQAAHRLIIDRLNLLCRGGDTVTLLGENEFAILSGSLSTPEDSDNLVRAILSEFAGAINFEGESAQLFPVIGLTFVDSYKRDSRRTRSEAEAAADIAQDAGTGPVHAYNRAIAAIRDPREMLRGQLTVAMETGAFDLRFQDFLGRGLSPTGTVIASTSFDHPQLGKFLPVQVENMIWHTGLYNEYFHWITSAIAMAVRGWDASNAGVSKVMLRLPDQAFTEGDILESLLWAIDAAELQPDRIVLSISGNGTERDLSEELTANLHRAREIGFEIFFNQNGGVEFDLASKRAIGPSALCVSRGSIANIDSSAQLQIRLSRIVRHAKKFKIDLYAEGVESNEEVRMLTRLGIAALSGTALTAPRSAMGFASTNSNGSSETSKLSA